MLDRYFVEKYKYMNHEKSAERSKEMTVKTPESKQQESASDNSSRKGLLQSDDSSSAEVGTSHAVVPNSQIKIKGTRKNQSVTALDRKILKKMMVFIGEPDIRVTLWDGEQFDFGNKPAVAYLKFHDRAALYKLISDPEMHFGDLYSSGRIDVDGDMVRFMEQVYIGIQKNGASSKLHDLYIRFGHRPIMNSIDKAKNNIHHHYDLGNKFYELWLDKEAMQYTCAYFPDPEYSIEQAQIAKLHHVCRKLQLKPGDRVVEAGCGWGGLARFMAKHYGVHVKAYNISHQQIIYARNKAEQEGLSDLVEYVEDDYRNIKGTFDVFVSVGMLEHVGSRDYATMGEVIARCLTPDGRGLVHSIGRIKPGPMNAWIERRIFPGAYPPSLTEMMQIFEPNKLAVQDVENLRLHYAKTLEHWLVRFEQHVDEITSMMDEAFVRAWRLYLAGSIAAFTMSELQLYQIVFNREHSNVLPWSRAHLYAEQPEESK